MPKRKQQVEPEEWSVDGILGSEFVLHYTVKWSDGSTTKEPRDNLIPGSEELVAEFHHRSPDQPSIHMFRLVYGEIDRLRDQLRAHRQQYGETVKEHQRQRVQASINHQNDPFGFHAQLQTRMRDLDEARRYIFELQRENQMLKAARLPDAIQAALFVPHQKAVLDENERLKKHNETLKARVDHVDSASQGTIRSLQADRTVLVNELKALRKAQEASISTWESQIKVLEQALIANGFGTGQALPNVRCRQCNGTESVGLRRTAKGRRMLCHSCGLLLVKQDNAIVPREDKVTQYREPNESLLSENRPGKS